jgi:uncharacterized protein YndB with AHSA1/START domain
MEIKTSLQIAKSPKEVYQAIINPDQMKNYFISESSGQLEESKKIEWKFPEFKDAFFIEVIQMVDNQLVVFEWPGTNDQLLKVQIELSEVKTNHTLVTITEGEMNFSEENLIWVVLNTAGWAHFLACLKAYLEFGINLRKGSFDHLSDF